MKNYRAPLRRGQTSPACGLSSRDYPEIRSFRPERLHIPGVGARKPSQFRLFAAFCLGKTIAYNIPDAARNTVATPLSWQAALPKRQWPPRTGRSLPGRGFRRPVTGHQHADRPRKRRSRHPKRQAGSLDRLSAASSPTSLSVHACGRWTVAVLFGMFCEAAVGAIHRASPLGISQSLRASAPAS